MLKKYAHTGRIKLIIYVVTVKIILYVCISSHLPNSELICND